MPLTGEPIHHLRVNSPVRHQAGHRSTDTSRPAWSLIKQHLFASRTSRASGTTRLGTFAGNRILLCSTCMSTLRPISHRRRTLYVLWLCGVYTVHYIGVSPYTILAFHRTPYWRCTVHYIGVSPYTILAFHRTPYWRFTVHYIGVSPYTILALYRTLYWRFTVHYIGVSPYTILALYRTLYSIKKVIRYEILSNVWDLSSLFPR